ncbi:hypothetical protein [Rhodomicrobium sp.]|uniref:hypothetical protein n=1 Tax=Rhodomicrobium sp. TaxID=2720632 RepID=UPI0039E3476D
MSQTIISMKWGKRYGPDYVNRLHSMIRRHTARPTRFVCYTDDVEGIDEGVETYPLPHIELPEKQRWWPWRKISLWQRELDGISGEVLFLDLDVVITGSLDDFFDYKPGHFCVARNWTQPKERIGNTSVYRFPVGGHPYLYDRLMSDFDLYYGKYRNSQTFISREISDMEFWPDAWCHSFKHSLIPKWPLNLIKTPPLPAGTKVVAFTGKPDPDEAVVGRWPRDHWYHVFYKQVRPTPWIAEHWR